MLLGDGEHLSASQERLVDAMAKSLYNKLYNNAAEY